ncbi:hypothetical protein PVAP13_2KG528800 [Panicum virgatum]|uniref:Uncharacterized protein n=1 Tax=Panicum virgatum TaxID=38727 RepID=A0A8T0WB59_PANVG|nr:hypothetical protein PVAP13_2KG528800 [Panicum virgatum]KAG2646751.1 hypothetical protein PVAP13_2KG528800 [Panicum virgatum]
MNCDIIKIAELFSAKICLLTSFRYACLVEIIPRDATPTRDLPTRKTKKKHWLF